MVFVASCLAAPEADPAFAYSVVTPLVYAHHTPLVYAHHAPLQENTEFNCSLAVPEAYFKLIHIFILNQGLLEILSEKYNRCFQVIHTEIVFKTYKKMS